MYSGCSPCRFAQPLLSLWSGEGLCPLNFDARAARGSGSRGTIMTKTSSRWRFAAAVSPLALVIGATPAMAKDKDAAATVTASDAAATAAAQPAAADQTAANAQDTSASAGQN